MLIILEVMDKEPSLVAIWLTYLALGIAGFSVARFRRWLVVVPAVLIFFFAASQLSEWLDPFVGPAMRHEAGTSYFVQTGIATFWRSSIKALH
jgi:hypothetical protein